MCHSVERSDGRGCLERIIRYVGSCLKGMPYVNDRGRGSECFQGVAVSDHASRGIYSVWFSCLLLFGQNEKHPALSELFLSLPQLSIIPIWFTPLRTRIFLIFENLTFTLLDRSRARTLASLAP